MGISIALSACTAVPPPTEGATLITRALASTLSGDVREGETVTVSLNSTWVLNGTPTPPQARELRIFVDGVVQYTGTNPAFVLDPASGGLPFMVAERARIGGEWSAWQMVANQTIAAVPTPSAAGALPDQTFTQGTAVQTLDASGDFTLARAVIWSVQSGPAGVTITAAGVISFDTNTLGEQADTAIVVRATDTFVPTRFADSGLSLTIESGAVQPVSFTVTGPSGAQAGFTATDVTTHGTYGDGSPWVTAGASTQLSATTPTATLETGIIGSITYTNAALNGLMRDPGQSSVPLGTLAARQVDNHRITRDQGWDGRVRSGEVGYDAGQNIDPTVTGQPVALTQPMSLVKAVSKTLLETNNDRDIIGDFGVLTVVSSAPPHADACRPAVASPDKTSRWRTSDIVLPTSDPRGYAGMLSYAEIVSQTGFLAHAYDSDNSGSRALNPGPTQGYGGTTAQNVGEALLWLVTGNGSATEREEVARRICQMGEDVRARILQGAIHNRSGGYSVLTSAILTAAEILLPGRFIDAITLTVEATSGLSNIGGVTAGQRAISEFDRVEELTQAIIDLDPADITAPYTQDQLGHPEWCSTFGRPLNLPGGGGQEHSTLENYLENPNLTYVTGDTPSYRFITMRSMVPIGLVARLTGSSLPTTLPLYWQYLDRHMGYILDNPALGTSNALPGWIVEAWSDLRGTADLWSAGWIITAGDGQSNILACPTPPQAPTATAGDGQATLEAV